MREGRGKPGEGGQMRVLPQWARGAPGLWGPLTDCVGYAWVWKLGFFLHEFPSFPGELDSFGFLQTVPRALFLRCAGGRAEAPARTPTKASWAAWLGVRTQARGSHSPVPGGTRVLPQLLWSLPFPGLRLPAPSQLFAGPGAVGRHRRGAR